MLRSIQQKELILHGKVIKLFWEPEARSLSTVSGEIKFVLFEAMGVQKCGGVNRAHLR